MRDYSSCIYSYLRTGDPVATIILGIIAGQSIALVFLYIKRLFYCILLGLMLPFVIAMDTMKKIIGQKGGLFEKWLAQFSLTVFMQSIHAFLLYFSLILITQLARNMLGGTGNEAVVIDAFAKDKEAAKDAESSAGLIAVTQMIIIASFSKVEGTVKSLLGLGESTAGNMKGAGRESLLGLAMGRNAFRSIKDNATGTVSGVKKVRELRNKVAKATPEAGAAAGPKLPAAGMSGTESVKNMIEEGNKAAVIGAVGSKAGVGAVGAAGVASAQAGGLKPGAAEADIAAQIGDRVLGASGLGNNEINRIDSTLNKIVQALEKNNQVVEKSANGGKENSKEALQKELRLAERELVGKATALAASPSIVLAGGAIGAGAGETEIASALITAGDKIAESVGKELAQNQNVTNVVYETGNKVQQTYEEHITTNHQDRKNAQRETYGGNRSNGGSDIDKLE
ncbi:MAG: hypothetical protein RR922_04815 [Clostridia bacterium]